MSILEQKSYRIRCDGCGVESLEYITDASSAIKATLEDGWELDGPGKDFCPACVSNKTKERNK